jgi:hypothetical protein
MNAKRIPVKSLDVAVKLVFRRSADSIAKIELLSSKKRSRRVKEQPLIQEK